MFPKAFLKPIDYRNAKHAVLHVTRSYSPVLKKMFSELLFPFLIKTIQFLPITLLTANIPRVTPYKYKIRNVANGDKQIKGLNFPETIALCTIFFAFRVFFSIS